MMIASSITDDSEKSDEFFWGDHYSFRQRSQEIMLCCSFLAVMQLAILAVIDHNFMAAFTQFWQKTKLGILKKHAAHLQIFHDTQFEKHQSCVYLFSFD